MSQVKHVDIAKVHYTDKLEDGTVFDTNAFRKSLICTKFLDDFLLINRTTRLGVRLSEHLYMELSKLCQSNADTIPDWLGSAFRKLKFQRPEYSKLSDLILLRRLPILNFGGASYEITEACNYRCSHCYLGNKPQRNLGIDEKKAILDLIERAGCLWLQITGGEPLLDKNFTEIYRYACIKGFLINLSTNSSLLNKPQIIKTLSDCPPYRISVSLYGATERSYESVTKTRGSFTMFIKALELAREADFNIRLNIILTKFNEKERESMKSLANNFGFEYHVYPYLSPTLEGSDQPLRVMADCSEEDKNRRSKVSKKESWHDRCLAGRTFFHVDSLGKVSICKVARTHTIDLLQEGVEGLKKLGNFADLLLKTPKICLSCASIGKCSTCPPRLFLYKRSGTIPHGICHVQDKYTKGGDKK